ncbi:MAG: glycosyltransferase family 2 protein [Candidatus Buchananbacteria bacterium]|nr:glycosyltransferase family 2 protein [Candidatus Buchananbacteria bacterium]
MDLSIVILNYKQKGLVKQCVKGIVTAQPQLSYEIIVVDNNSGDGVLEMVQNMFLAQSSARNQQQTLPLGNNLVIPPIKTIAAKTNGGFAVGNNLGIKAAAGEYIMVLNPDIAVVPGALEKMVDYMRSHPATGIIGPKLINPDGSVQYSARRFPNFLTPLYRRTLVGRLPWARRSVDSYLMKDLTHQLNQEVDWLFGACLLISRPVLDKIGLLDERFFMYFEDLDLCRRCWTAGYQVIYFTEVEMVHYHQRLSAERSGVLGVFSRGGRIHIISGIKYFVKYLGARLPNR